MKKFKFTINGNKYDVEIGNVDDKNAEVYVNGTKYKVAVDQEITATKTPKLVRPQAVPSTDTHPAVAKTSSPDSPKGGGTITSPLPGVVLDVFVKEGDTVKIGHKLIILEAMKMENNINSDKDGVVTTVRIKKGDNVMEGDVLILIGE
jgi:biotin carboxyl carrier protein